MAFPRPTLGSRGLGVIFERSKVGMSLGLDAGLSGRAFVALVAAGPVFFLFHPTFVERIALPMLAAIGAR